MVGQHRSDPSHGVLRPTRDRVVMIDANGRLGEAPTHLLGELLPAGLRRQWLLPPRHHAQLGHGAPASFEPLPFSTWTSRAGKEHEIDSVLIPSAWRDVVEWSAVIPRGRIRTGPGGSSACGHSSCFPAQAHRRCRPLHILLARRPQRS